MFVLLFRTIPFLLFLPLSVHAEPVSIHLANGDRLSGELIEQNEEFLLLDSAVLGKLRLAASDVSQVSAVEGQPQAKVAINRAADDIDAMEIRLPLEEDLGLFGTGWLTYWKRRLDLGIAGSEGDTDSLQINLAFSADYESPDTRISHKINYYRAESDDELSDHSFYTSVNRDWLHVVNHLLLQGRATYGPQHCPV